MTRRCLQGCRAAVAAALAAAALVHGARAAKESGRATDGGSFYVVWSPTPDPVPLNQLFRLDLAVYEGTGRSRPAADVEVAVRGWMPEHEHGMNLVPEVHPLGGGRFAVEGMLFHMPGRWQLVIEFRRQGNTERATFEIPVAGAVGVNFSTEERRRIRQLSPLPAPPPDPTNRVADRRDAALLGQRLFFEARLSPGGRTSCASCHDPSLGWSNGQPMAMGDRRATRRHVPTLWNVAYGRWFFWDGRADSLWAQALEALEGELDQASNRLRIAHLLAQDRGLRAAYEGVFGPLPDLSDLRRFPADGRPDPDHPEGPLQQSWSALSATDQETINRIFVNLGKAIAAYERRLISRDSPFDRYAAGLRTGDRRGLRALDPSAERGLQLFVGKAGCWQCHAGPNFSDGEFHRLGVPESASFHDLARMRGILLLLSNPFNGVGAWSDAPAASPTRFLPRGETHAIDEFKTPTLRNVALTAPYMHNGRLATLEDVVRFYSETAGAPAARPAAEKMVRPLHLSGEEMAGLVAFLKSLTGAPLDPATLTPLPLSPQGREGKKSARR